jgi:hypothetical protein
MAIHCPKYEWMLDMEVGPGKGIMAQHQSLTWAELDTDETFTQVYPSQHLCLPKDVMPIRKILFGIANYRGSPVWCSGDTALNGQ